jgi:hypothetical protein
MRHVPRSVDALFGQSQSRLLIDLDSHDLTAHDLTNGIYITDTITTGMASPQLVYLFISRTFPLTDAHNSRGTPYSGLHCSLRHHSQSHSSIHLEFL